MFGGHPADYELEAGATRNYEPWRDKEKQTAAAVADREEEERGNAMKVGQPAAVCRGACTVEAWWPQACRGSSCCCMRAWGGFEQLTC